MIRSFKNKATLAISLGKHPKGFGADVVKAGHRKLERLAAAVTLIDLMTPPGNRLEALKGDRAGQYSIRANDQFRVCFIWRDGGADDVEITDYH